MNHQGTIGFIEVQSEIREISDIFKSDILGTLPKQRDIHYPSLARVDISHITENPRSTCLRVSHGEKKNTKMSDTSAIKTKILTMCIGF